MKKNDGLPDDTLIAASHFNKEKNYWQEILSGELVKSSFPYDYLPSKTRKREMADLMFSLTGELFSRLLWVINESHHRLQMVLVTALSILLQKYSGNTDIIVGTPIYKQEQESDFINTMLPLSIRVESHLTFKELLFRVRHTLVQAIENQNYPLKAMLNDLNLPDEEEDFPLFDIVILLENLQDKHYIQHVDPRLIFSFLRTDDELQTIFTYDSSIYKKDTLERIAAHFKQLLEAVLFQTDIQLFSIDILSGQEKQQLLENFNDTAVDYPLDKMLHDALAEQVEKTPGQTAAVYEAHHITYRELLDKSRYLAGVLRTRGMKSDTITAVMTERSVEMLIAVYAVLNAGGAYLPIATTYPEDRVTYILKDSRVRFLLTHDHFCQRFAAICEPLDVFSLVNNNPVEDSAGRIGGIFSPQGMAYVIYTSGSTGKPKGVMMEHLPVLNLVYGLQEVIYRKYPNEKLRVALIAPYEFDASAQQIFGALLLGHSIYIVPDDTKLDSYRLLKYYKKHRIHITDGTPTHLRLLLENLSGNTRGLWIRHFIIAGEALPKKVAADLLNHFDEHMPELTNFYGPTETCVDSTFYQVAAGNLEQLDSIPIGKPLPNEQLYILNHKMQLQPIGVAGELYIGGLGLGRGYLNKPELTAEKFDHDLWDYLDYHDNNQKLLRGGPDASRGGFLEKSPPGRRRQKLYKTGDLARWLPDGNIDFIGRIDQQIKLRGYRIELGEIENLLRKHHEIKEAVVKVTETNGNKKLCAYIVSDRELTVTQLREYLSGNLPLQMIPDYFLRLDKIPLKSNGKVDGKALDLVSDQLGTGIEYVEPESEIEEIIVGIWKEVLNLEKVSINDSFFEIGGNSLSIVTVNSRLKQALNRNIVLVDMFRFPTVRSLGRFLETPGDTDKDSLSPAGKRVEAEHRGKDQLKNLKKRARNF